MRAHVCVCVFSIARIYVNELWRGYGGEGGRGRMDVDKKIKK